MDAIRANGLRDIFNEASVLYDDLLAVTCDKNFTEQENIEMAQQHITSYFQKKAQELWIVDHKKLIISFSILRGGILMTIT